MDVLEISAEQLAELSARTAHDLPRECCGILLGSRSPGRTSVETVVAAANVAADPLSSFEIAPEALFELHRRARREGREVVGYYHSHPDGRAVPSRRDRAAAWPEASHLIVATAAGAVSEQRCWRLRSGDFVEQILCVSGAAPHQHPRSPARGPR